MHTRSDEFRTLHELAVAASAVDVALSEVAEETGASNCVLSVWAYASQPLAGSDDPRDAFADLLVRPDDAYLVHSVKEIRPPSLDEWVTHVGEHLNGGTLNGSALDDMIRKALNPFDPLLAALQQARWYRLKVADRSRQGRLWDIDFKDYGVLTSGGRAIVHLGFSD